MKNFLIVMLLVVIAGLAFFLAKQEGITSVDQLVSSVTNSVNKAVDSVKSEVASVSSDNVPAPMASLPNDTAFYLLFPAKSIQPAITHLSDFLVKVKSSGIGKKLELEKMIDQAMTQDSPPPSFDGSGASPDFGSNPDFGSDNGMGTSPFDSGEFGSPPPAMGSSSKPNLQEILKAVNNFEKLEISARAKTLEGKATPLIKVSAAFKDDQYSKLLQTNLDGFVEMSQAMQGQGPELKKDPQDPTTYVVNVKPPMAPVEVMARLKTGGKEINATIGIIAGAAPAQKVAPMTGLDSIIPLSSVGKDASGTYVNGANFMSLFDVFIAYVPESKDGEHAMLRKVFESVLGTYVSGGSSAIFDKGFNGKSCARTTPNSPIFAPHKAAIEAGTSKNSKFYKLIGPKTSFAIRADGPFLGATFSSAFSSAGSSMLGVADPMMAEAAKESMAQFKLVEDDLGKLQIKDFGVLINAPTVSFVPDAGIYIEHGQGVTIDQFGAVLQGLFLKLAPDNIKQSGVSPINMSKDNKGQSQIVIPGPDGYQVTFRSISPTQILGTLQEAFFDEVKGSLDAKDSYLDDAKLSAKGVDAKISDNVVYYYLSTSSLMPLAKQFAPFATMSKPELKITDAEINEFLNLLDFNILATGSQASPEDNVLCYQTKAVVY